MDLPNKTNLPNVDVWMMNRNLSDAPHFSFPSGYSMRFFQEGDEAKWVLVQNAADEFFTATVEIFAQSYAGPAERLAERVMFLVDPKGKDIGSISAWESKKLTGELIGQVHWVAIVPEAQGLGLAKPMLSYTCQLLKKVGYESAFLSTNTRRIPALNLYLKFGFKPYLVGEAEFKAWKQITPLLEIDPLDSDIWDAS